MIPPFLKLTQDIIRDFLMFHLVSVACVFDKNQFVSVSSRHMGVQVPEESGRTTSGEIVISSHQHGTAVCDFFSLGEVSVSFLY